MGKFNALVVHGGAPTAVMNASLYGAVREAGKHGEIEHFYAAVGGSGAILRERFLDLKTVPDELVSLLPATPASAIGTSRDALEAGDYAAIARILQKHNIRHVFFNGGNGTMDTCGKVYRACREAGAPVQVIGIPKTIDNDIAVTDHAPGYGSSARYIAGTVSEISQDVRSLPIHVCIVETMGRNCGWITAASALARTGCGDGPDLIYLPERPFDPRRFLEDVERLHREKGGVLVAASEGLRDLGGNPIVEPVVRIGRAAYYGDVGSHLSNLVIRELGIKARSEKPGIGGRASIAFQSPLDCAEAEEAGRRAVRAAWDGQTGVMVGLRRISDSPYRTEDILVPIEQVMLRERTMPDEFISPEGNDVTPAFLQWCRPLLGGPLRRFVSFRQLL